MGVPWSKQYVHDDACMREWDEWFTAHGTGSNLGWFCKKENEQIANKMKILVFYA